MNLPAPPRKLPKAPAEILLIVPCPQDAFAVNTDVNEALTVIEFAFASRQCHPQSPHPCLLYSSIQVLGFYTG